MLVLFAVFNKTLIGQINLVPNPSFEEFTEGCPQDLNEMPLGWYKWRESPNSFSTCVEPQNLTDSLGWAPWTGFGSQEPFEGESFIGLSAFSPYPKPGFPPEFREFIGCELLEPMVVDSMYHVSFRTSLGFIGNYYWVTWACDKLGVIFTTTGDYDWQENPFAVPNFASVYSEEII
ncbi:MAG: hypothetical protein JNM00_03110, partial [Flavobacteriales bacterium]|nr:hypothetical protein [Flavobacteriales bacterium]